MRRQGLRRRPDGRPLGALACIALLGPVLLSGCILDRSGTQRSRTGLDGSVPEMDAGRADGGVVGRDATTPDAGPPPECSAGDARTVPCGGCGSLTERCEGGGWVATGPCEEMPSCPAGMVETEMEACGSCGTHSRTRTCGGCDGWGDWTPFGACAGEGDCAPGDVRTISESCACDRGTRTVTDSCNASCTWDRSTGACSQQTCGTLFGDVCPNDRAWRPCTMSLRARQCRCDGNSGDFVDCDNSTC
ncbi:MAG: hypothetical protein H6719_16985 [Sandaracinaceae bacterium]|nr:hypothetical protein [Sandaracinaceae bacterium]